MSRQDVSFTIHLSESNDHPRTAPSQATTSHHNSTHSLSRPLSPQRLAWDNMRLLPSYRSNRFAIDEATVADAYDLMPTMKQLCVSLAGSQDLVAHWKLLTKCEMLIFRLDETMTMVFFDIDEEQHIWDAQSFFFLRRFCSKPNFALTAWWKGFFYDSKNGAQEVFLCNRFCQVCGRTFVVPCGLQSGIDTKTGATATLCSVHAK